MEENSSGSEPAATIDRTNEEHTPQADSGLETSKDHEVIIKPHRPGLREKVFFLVSGIVVSVPLTLFVSGFSDSLCVLMPILYANVCSIAIVAPLVEEFAKAYPLFYRHGETQRSIFTLGFLVGLGFGISEFLVYVLTLGAPVYVRLSGILFHATSTSITAYGIGTKRTVWFYLVAVALHFSNNFAALFGLPWALVGPAVVVLAFLLSWRLYRRTSEKIVDWQSDRP